MAKLHCYGAVKDDLHDFAEQFLFTAPLASWLWPQEGCDVGEAETNVLHRDGQFQVELCRLAGGLFVPVHVHPRIDSIEVSLFGAARFTLDGVDPYSTVPDSRLPKLAKLRGLRIPADCLHGATTLPQGALFLSIQRWKDGPPTGVLADYVGDAVTPEHHGMIGDGL